MKLKIPFIFGDSRRPMGLGVPKFGVRADIKNIPINEGTGYIFLTDKIDAFYNLEKKAIENHIENEVANEYKSDEIGTSESICNPNSKKRELLLKSIEQNYTRDIKEEDKQLLEDAKSGMFKGKYHEKIFYYEVIALFIVILETALLIFIGMAQGGGFNPIILLYGVLLIFGYMMVGLWLGDTFYVQQLGDLGKHNEGIHNKSELTLVGLVGVITILFVAGMRAYGAGSPGEMIAVFSITVVLSSVAIAFDTMWHLRKQLREWAIGNQERALGIYAIEQHYLALKKGIYENFIDRECQKYKQDKDYQKEDNV